MHVQARVLTAKTCRNVRIAWFSRGASCDEIACGSLMDLILYGHDFLSVLKLLLCAHSVITQHFCTNSHAVYM